MILLIDQLTLILYNSCCKIIVKKWAGEKILRLLIVEDEKQMCDTVARSLYAAGYEVDTCYDGAEALECILAENYDLIVLDLNLPGMDGMDLLKELRKENEETKVLILSARGQIADKVEGLDAGANDYMEKPFHLQELEARIRSLTRRKFVQKDVCLESGGIKFDTIKREAYANGTLVSLTRKRKRNFGISASPPWQTGKSGRIDRACLGCLRGQLQRIHPRPYVFASPKAQRRYLDTIRF